MDIKKIPWAGNAAYTAESTPGVTANLVAYEQLYRNRSSPGFHKISILYIIIKIKGTSTYQISWENVVFTYTWIRGQIDNQIKGSMMLQTRVTEVEDSFLGIKIFSKVLQKLPVVIAYLQ